jgi:exopolysaccharide biosynthesis polyprenyl glycosylphosphotransferase
LTALDGERAGLGGRGEVESALSPDVPVVRMGIVRKLRVLMGVTATVDLGLLVLAVLMASRLRAVAESWGLANVGHELVLRSSPYIIVAWFVALVVKGGYSLRSFGAGPHEFRAVSLASFTTAGAVGLACYLGQLPLSRGFVALTFLIGTPLLLVERYALRRLAHGLRRNGRLMHRVVAVGGPSGISEVVDALRRSRYVGYEVVGACLPDGIAVEPQRFDVPILGRVADTRRLCQSMGADTVLVTRGAYDSAEELRRIAWDLEGSSIDLVVVPSVTDVAGPRIRMRPVAGLPLLHLEQPQAGKAGGLPKRVFDVVVASVALAALSPALAMVALLVRLQDGGPVLFRQARVGRGGTAFDMLKFRSMTLDAEERLEQLRDLNESDGVLFKIKEDPRITRVGVFLRRYSIDELPQLINVLRGEMSLVGPRPPLPSEVDQYADHVHRRLLVRPGLTGLWQVSGRSSLSWDESVRLDLFYVDNWSLFTDLLILARTARAVLGKSGAY